MIHNIITGTKSKTISPSFEGYIGSDFPPFLFITPLSPPMGGVAKQASLLAESKAFQRLSYSFIRTNPLRDRENPSSTRSLFSIWPITIYRKAMNEIRSLKPHVILLQVNGDLSLLRNATLAFLVARKARAKLAIHMHASRRGFWHSRKVGSKCKRGLCIRTLERFGYAAANALLMKADAFSQLTTEIDLYYQSAGLRPATHIIPNAVPLRKVSINNKSGKRFLFVGRLSREKGFFDLLMALEQLESYDWNLDILGSAVSSDDENIILSALANHKHKSRIHLNGTVLGEDKWKYFDNASFLVLPTHLDVFPNVILEAMTSGLGVISTPVGEIDNILPSSGGVLINPGDVQSLSNSIHDFLDHPDSVRQMGISNQESVKEFGQEKVAMKFKEMILSTIISEEHYKCP